MLIDSHAHLTDPRYDGAEEIIADMRGDGLERIVTVGFDLDSSLKAAETAERHEAVYFTAGFHPCDTGKADDKSLSRIEELLKHPKCVALGEIGLDYHYDDTDKDLQKKILKEQLFLAERADMPVVFHVRDAFGDFDTVVDECGVSISAVMHCFSGSLEWAKKCLARGWYVSFAGPITFKNTQKFGDVIRAVPNDKIMAETDCPYLAPTPYRGQTNYPKYVRFQVEKIAEYKEISYLEAETVTANNAYAFYKKMKRPI